MAATVAEAEAAAMLSVSQTTCLHGYREMGCTAAKGVCGRLAMALVEATNAASLAQLPICLVLPSWEVPKMAAPEAQRET